MTKIRIYFPTVNLSLVKVLGKIEYLKKKKKILRIQKFII